MTKHTIEIELPDGWEPDGNSWATDRDSHGTFMMTIKTRQSWQWPEWLTAEWIIEYHDGKWFYSQTEPILDDSVSWRNCYGGDLTYTTFEPPLCTDWRQSKRRNPRSKQP